MSNELGRIEKPLAESFKKGRRLYFIPLIYSGKESPPDYIEKFNKYWNQVENQIISLELKLGKITRVYHELLPVGSEEGIKAIKELNEKSYQVVVNRLDKGAQLEATEEAELLTEVMDWSRCLVTGLQNPKVVRQVYEFYTEASKKRAEYIGKHIDETLGVDESGVLIMREGHQVQFSSDIEVFYVTPPAFDEIKRWLREHEARSQGEEAPEAQSQGE